jgi:hypothetical protein
VLDLELWLLDTGSHSRIRRVLNGRVRVDVASKRGCEVVGWPVAWGVSFDERRFDGRDKGNDKRRGNVDMGRTKMLGLCLVAVFAMGAVMASAASATEPYFKAENSKGEVSILTSGQSRTVKVSMPYAGEMHIPGLGVSIYCTNASGTGVVSNHYSGATRLEGRFVSSAGIKFEGCGVVNEPSCHVGGGAGGAGKIQTNELVARLGYQPGSTANVEADLYAEEWFGIFTTIELSDCVLSGNYPIAGALIAGIGPTSTLLSSTIQGVTALEGIQEFSSIEFPASKEKLTGEELYYSFWQASLEGALEFTAPSGEKLGIFTS